MTEQASQAKNLQRAVPFFSVEDMEASLRFYIEGLGFAICKQWTPRGKIEWCWIERDSVAIMMQEPRKKDNPVHTAPANKGLGIVIATQCRDALDLYQEFKARNLPISEPFVGNQLWTFHVNDPDGYRLEFASPTDVPEETSYTQWLDSSNKTTNE
jgi:lactoylglutathione lyase